MYFLFFIFGLCVGSFLNVVIDRLPRGKSIIKNRSHCESCKKTLKWYDLVPVLSFTFLKGKCRYCHSSLSIQYPIVELLTGVLFVLTIIYLPGTNLLSIIYYLFIFSSLIAIFFIDLKHGIIPDKIIYPAIVITLIFNFQFSIFNQISILNYAVSAIGAFLFFLMIFLFTKGRGMGFGDVKLAFLVGLILGFPRIIAALYIAFLTGAVVSFILIMLRKKKLKGGTIPFGPFLVFGTWVSLLFGEKIIKIALELVQRKL